MRTGLGRGNGLASEDLVLNLRLFQFPSCCKGMWSLMVSWFGVVCGKVCVHAKTSPTFPLSSKSCLRKIDWAVGRECEYGTLPGIMEK